MDLYITTLLEISLFLYHSLKCQLLTDDPN